MPTREKPLYTTPALRYFPNGLAESRDTGVWFGVDSAWGPALGDLFEFPPNPSAHTYWLEAYHRPRRDTVAVRVEKRYWWWVWRRLYAREFEMLLLPPSDVLRELFPGGGRHTLHIRLVYRERL